MRRFLLCASALVAVLGAVALAQAKLSVEDYGKMMKANAQAAGAMNKAIGSGAYADARTQVATLRTNYMGLQAFWSDKEKDDAVGIVKDGLTRLDALDKMLGAATVDQWRRRLRVRSSAAPRVARATSSIVKAMRSQGSSSRQG